MAPGGYGNQGFKVCPECQLQIPLAAQTCSRCGHIYRQQFPAGAPQPNNQQAPNPTQAFYNQNPSQGFFATYDLTELARRSNESRKIVLWTFWVGLFCLWPVWIVTYLEFSKMRTIKEQIALMGLDVRWWQLTYHAPDAF